MNEGIKMVHTHTHTNNIVPWPQNENICKIMNTDHSGMLTLRHDDDKLLC